MTGAPSAPGAEPPGPREGAPVTTTPACGCRESGRTVLPDVMRASAEPACGRCGAHTAVLTPAVYIACFLSDSTMPGRVVRVRCGTCGLHRHVSVADVHEAGCASLLHAPAPDPLHVRWAVGVP